MSDKNKKKSDDNMVSVAEKMAERAQGLAASFFESILRFMKDTAHWYEDASKRIREYLRRFFSAFLRLFSALGKLSLFYIPSLILLFIGVVKNSYFAYIAAGIWMLAISAIGLSSEQAPNISTMIPEKKYTKFVKAVKERIISSRISVARSVNRELIALYWEIGRLIVEKQNESGWGKAVVDTLSKDLQKEFPSVTGFSPRNLWDMKRLYEQYSGHEYLRQLVAEIPWGHNLLIMNRIKDYDTRSYYLESIRKWGWSHRR